MLYEESSGLSYAAITNFHHCLGNFSVYSKSDHFCVVCQISLWITFSEQSSRNLPPKDTLSKCTVSILSGGIPSLCCTINERCFFDRWHRNVYPLLTCPYILCVYVLNLGLDSHLLFSSSYPHIVARHVSFRYFKQVLPHFWQNSCSFSKREVYVIIIIAL